MDGPYFVSAGERDNSYRVFGPGLSHSADDFGSIVFESSDKKIADITCAGLCRAYRAGARSNQDAIKRLLDIQQ